MNKKPKLEITQHLIPEAKAHKGGWVYQIVNPPPEADGVPPEFILGAWRVNDSGILTGEFVSNEHFNAFTANFYRPPSKVYEQAKKHPGSWFYQIDSPYEDAKKVPQNKIVGAWLVDKNGNLTGQFQINPSYQGD
jgi:hypothetical protein